MNKCRIRKDVDISTFYDLVYGGVIAEQDRLYEESVDKDLEFNIVPFNVGMVSEEDDYIVSLMDIDGCCPLGFYPDEFYELFEEVE